MGRIILGLVITAVGVFIIVKTEGILSNFGRIEFFERHLGTEGGSRLGYKLVGLLAVFIGMMIMTNMIGGLMQWILSPLLKFSQPIK